MEEPPERASRRIRAAHLAYRPAGIGALILAACLIFVFAYIFVLKPAEEVPVPDARSIACACSWEPVTKTSDSSAERGTFKAVASGDAVWTAAGGASRSDASGVTRSAYDAAGRSETTTVSLDGAGGSGAGAAGTRTTGAWPPVWRIAAHDPLDYQGLAAVVRAAADDSDRVVGVKELEVDGRKVWRAAMTLHGDKIQLVVDERSGIVTYYADDEGTFTADVDWDHAKASAADVTAAAQTASGGGFTTLKDTDYDYAPTLVAASERTGFQALASTLEPDGFRLHAVATMTCDGRPADWFADDAATSQSASADELGVAQLYTRGLTWFTVEELGPKATRAYKEYIAGQISTAASSELSFESVQLQYGWFAGATAYSWYETTGPALLVTGHDRTMYVTGSLTRNELISVAEGMKASTANAGADASPSP